MKVLYRNSHIVTGEMVLLFNIVEKFYTISGEAPIAGAPIYLIRFTGCNLDCSYCDTEYKNEINYTLSFDDLVSDIQKAIDNYPSVSILLTGGEPLLDDRQGAITKLASVLSQTTFYIETNGAIKINDFTAHNVRYVVDWKTPSSGHGNSFFLNNLDSLRPGIDVIKIVTTLDDLPVVLKNIEIIKKVNPDLDVYLSPQWGKISFAELSSFIIDNKLPVSLSLQLHKIIWGEQRGV